MKIFKPKSLTVNDSRILDYLQVYFTTETPDIEKGPDVPIYEFEAILYPITNYHNSLNINKEQAFHFNYDNFILRGSFNLYILSICLNFSTMIIIIININ